MNAAQIHTTYKSVIHFLSLGELKNAFAKARSLVDELQIGEYTDKLDTIEQNYSFLLQYFITGTPDPQRKSVYNKLIARIYSLANELREELLFRNSSNFEYAQKRYFPHTQHHVAPTELLENLKYFHSQTEILLNQEENHETELNRIRSNYEKLLPELFGLFWLTTNFKSEEKAVFSGIIDNKYPGWIEKSLTVSALTLNLWRMFDENKLLLLFDCCQVENQQVRQRALVGLCFVLAKHNRFIPFYPAVRNRLVLLADDNHIVKNFLNIIIQIIGTAETEKISKKMREEILPEMMKISPLLKDKMDPDTLLNTDEWGEENPAWQEILEQSGVSDKLQELSELQMEGADVYMSTFSMLKSFPFFFEFSNWFMPFDAENSAVKELFKSEDKTLLSSFVNSVVMCNSDKYSFCLSILQMPQTQRGLLKQSFNMEAEQLEEMAKDEAMLTPDIVAKNISKQYIQDLFRFFKLYPQHNDFSDMYAFSLLMHRSYLFDILANDTDFKSNVAEYYFAKSHYSQSIELFEELAEESAPSAALYQKTGYSYQQTSQLQKALEAYLKADIIQPDDVWTVRKIALCYRLSGNFEKALEYYQHVDYLKPNQPAILLQVGNCFLQMGKYKEALNIYFKLDAENEDNIKVWRAITWCAFISGNLQQASYYIKKILESEPTKGDFLNAGHIAWCQNRLTDAKEMYKKCLSLQQNNWDTFMDLINADKQHLLANGVDEDEIPLLLDAVKD